MNIADVIIKLYGAPKPKGVHPCLIKLGSFERKEAIKYFITFELKPFFSDFMLLKIF